MSPGIQRDGTNFSGKGYIDGKWCRFKAVGDNTAVPRKIGGYSQLLGNLARTPRSLYVTPNGSNFDFYLGDGHALTRYKFNAQRNFLDIVDRTPWNFVPSDIGVWQVEVMYSVLDESAIVIAHNASNLLDINNQLNSNIYVGELNENARLIPVNNVAVSGGFATLHPYLFLFGNNGEILWSEPGKPETFDEASVNRISGQKIVRGESCAANPYNPGASGLFWGLSGLYKATFVGEPAQFRFDTIDNQCSILASRSVVSYNGLFYWIANDRFMMTDGNTTKEIPNASNFDFFFDNLNYARRQKIWGTKVPKYGEIWWFFPKGNSDECDHAIIYNVRLNCWYDTPISRSCGFLDPTFVNPVWCSATQIWQHEDGYDQNVDGNKTAIDSYFRTGNLAWCAIAPDKQWKGIERLIEVNRIEPDFIQSGKIDVTINAREYARSEQKIIAEEEFNENDTKIDLRSQGREVTMEFRSNVVGGFYELGNTLLDITIGDVRPGEGGE
jgi:hypothetical protein